jgi:hypothetical protein
VLKNTANDLQNAGIKTALIRPDGQQHGETDSSPAAVWKAAKFPEGYDFVLVVGMHHEPVPHGSVARTVDGKTVHLRSSRVNAWAILFYAPTATAIWCTMASATAGLKSSSNPLNQAAESAIANLDLSDIGEENIPSYFERLAEPSGLGSLDIAAMLAQTQRADAADAIAKAAKTKSAFKNSVPVVRYVNQRGVIQDYRKGSEEADARKYVEIAQPVMMRVLLMEHLRGMTGIQPCALLAGIPKKTDPQINTLGQEQAGKLGPLCADDEVVLIGELANSDSMGIFMRNRAAAIRNLGKCRVHVSDAMSVAKTYAERRITRRKGSPRVPAYLMKEAGMEAVKELNKQAK